MAFSKTLILIVSLCCLCLHAHGAAQLKPTRTRTTQSRVWNICRGTTNPILCYKTILPQFNNTRFNVYKALEVEVLVARAMVETTLARIKLLISQPGISKSDADSLSTCQDQYGNMFDSIAEALKEVLSRRAWDARLKFSAVLSYHSTCNDEFTGESPIASEAKVMFDLGGNCLDIMKDIEERESLRKGGGSKTNVPTLPAST